VAELAVTGLVKSFGTTVALDHVDIHAKDGELLTLLGPSGCGKSTTLWSIAGLVDPDAGRIVAGDTVLFDSDPAGAAGAGAKRRVDLPPEDRQCGVVFQSYAVWPHMTVADNVAYPLRLRRQRRSQRDARVVEVLEMVELAHLAQRYPHQLSGGQQQRVALARALAHPPRLLLLDEPFSNLDAKLRERARTWLRDLQRSLGTTTVFVTHDQDEAMEVADRIVVMNAGRVEQAGGPRDLYEHPANAFVMGFVGPITRLGELFIRPHDIEVRRQPNGTTAEAMVERLVHLGFEVRADLVLHDGQRLQAQLSREDAEQLELHQGQIVWIRPSRTRQFADAPAV
jgi:iron(III) transport system ATP-binding protein